MVKINRRFFLSVSVLLGIGLGVFYVLFAASRPTARAAPPVTTWFVDQATGDNSDDCLAWGTACKTIGAAVGKAAQGDVLSIGAGVYTENLTISGLTLTGLGPEVTIIDGGQAGRVLQTQNNVSIAHLAIRNGKLSSSTNGAGIYNFGTLSLVDTWVYSNTTAGSGAGIFTAGNLTIQDSLVTSNTASGSGGGIYTWYNTALTVTQSTIGWNTANSSGGGIFNLEAVFLEDVTIQGNRTGMTGAGLQNDYGAAAELNRVTVIENQTTNSAAGIYNPGAVLTITNSTIGENTAHSSTGIQTWGETAFVTLVNTTIAYNHNLSGSAGNAGGISASSDATVRIKNTIVALNDGKECIASGNWISEGHNLSSDTTCDLDGPGDLYNTQPQLGPLGNYQGQTQSYGLLASSPAVDAGENTGCPAVDQREAPRPVDGNGDGQAVCDIGSFELRSQFQIADVQVQEGNSGTTNAVFTVTVAPTSTAPIQVNFSTEEGTATAGVDYQAASGQLSFQAGEESKTITVMVNGDTAEENDETFLVRLSEVQGADLIDETATGQIIDDDGLPSLSIDNQTVTEGNSGIVQAVFHVTLSPASADTVTVNYATADGTAKAGVDYNAVSGQLSFSPGETQKTVTVQVRADTIDEGAEESFSVGLSSAVHAILADAVGAGTITDNDLANFSFAGGPQVLEGDSGLTQAYFTVNLTLKTSFTVTVDYTTQDGFGETGAVAGQDYLTATGTLTFAPGETTKTIPVQIIGDEELEGDESFDMRYSNGVPLSFGMTVTFATILDDEEHTVYLPLVVR